MSEVKKKYHCLECKKYYSSRSSLSNHRRRFHKKGVSQCKRNVTKCNFGVTQCNQM